MSSRQAPIVGLCIALMMAVLTTWERSDVRTGPWAQADFALLDAWTRAQPVRRVSDDLVLVEIDDDTLESHPTLIERRSELARLIDAIHTAGARTVAIDLFFAAPEQILPPKLTGDLDTWIDAPEPDTPPAATSLLERTHQETTGDAALEHALATVPTVLALHFGESGGLPTGDRSLTSGTYGQVVPGPSMPDASPRVIASLPRHNRAAERLGVITLVEDGGGARRLPLAKRSGPRHFVPFALQAVATHEGTGREEMAFVGPEGRAVLGSRSIPGDGNALWLNWRAPGSFPTISAGEVLEGGPQVRGIRDKLVLLGFSHLVHDRVGTPWGTTPGIRMHATAVDNVLQEDWLIRAPAWMDGGLALLVGGLTAFVFAVPGVRTGGRLVGIGAGVAIAVGVPGVLRVSQDLWIGSVGALLAVGGSGVAAASVAWLQEGAEARKLRSMFAHYVSDELVDALVADPRLVQLSGERRELTVLFSDIRDFTTFSERMPPLELVAFLNAYLTPMTRAVLEHRGFVDKFIGDAVMALYGAPVPDPSHAENACRSALAMHRALAAVRHEAARFGITLEIGIGVNTGEVAVGNMGSEERFEYTVLGDAVNLASRLEGLTKTYGVFCLLGPSTTEALPDAFRTRCLDLVRVKGKAEPVEIHELLGDAHTTVADYASLQTWDDALLAFRSGDLVAARQAFEQFVALNPDEPVAALYLERLDALGGRIPAGWDGVVTHTHK